MTRTPDELLAIAARLRASLGGTCDPMCHGRCKICPMEQMSEAADALEAVAQTVRDAVQEQVRKDAEICRRGIDEQECNIKLEPGNSTMHGILIGHQRDESAILAQFSAQAEQQLRESAVREPDVAANATASKASDSHLIAAPDTGAGRVLPTEGEILLGKAATDAENRGHPDIAFKIREGNSLRNREAGGGRSIHPSCQEEGCRQDAYNGEIKGYTPSPAQPSIRQEALEEAAKLVMRDSKQAREAGDPATAWCLEQTAAEIRALQRTENVAAPGDGKAT